MASAPQDISRSLQAFAAGFHEQGKQLSELHASSPSTFQHVVLSLLLEARDTPRFRFLIAYLSSRGLLQQCVHHLRQVDRGLAALVVELAERMLPDGAAAKSHLNGSSADPDISYLMGLLEAFSTGLNLLNVYSGPVEKLDSRVRARLAAILGKAARTHDAYLTLVQDPDPRVRANGIEALWGSMSEMAKTVFQRAASDSHHRVAANALVGLHLLGDSASVSGLAALIRRSEPLARAAAAWAMGRIGDPRFIPLLQSTRRLPGQDPTVVRNCLNAVKRIQHNSQSEQGEEVHLRILDKQRTHSGRMTLSVSACVPGRVPGQRLAPLFPGTAFHLSAGEHPVWDYDCEAVSASPVLAIAFLLPVGVEAMRAKARCYRAVMDEAFLRRRDADRIALALYAETPVVSPTTLYGPGALCADPAEIKDTLSDLPGPAQVPQGPLGPLKELLQGLRRFSGERHVIFVVDHLAGAFLDGPAPDLEGVKIHAVCTAQAPTAAARLVSTWVRASGGTLVLMGKEDDLTTACEDTAASLYLHYRLTCAEPKEPVHWSLQLASGEYHGKAPK